jgi:outer membrane protein TolC
VQIQAEAVETARRRVRAETLLLEIGRGEVRDLTDANDDQTDAEQNFTEAVIDYRLSGLELQRDLGVLQVGPNGTYEPVPLPVSLQP